MTNPLVDEIRSRLTVLAPEALDVHDDSAAHAGHAGAAAGGGHFDVLIVSDAFAGLNSLARHRKVYALLGDLMPHRIHALSLKALTPDEL
ncbi:BolA family protein [Jeongeupia naejangsanensis]|uniref:BolA family transcriptional regulator n=1 Tax=Jeongeupia naejangsanensis TaxID=613195 RepID=A0ABS2BGE0_9NEIS|nr:BolA family protein [Jeongeupia naejangsanensis]MBM3114669.1 BolA family transcriptional regulator [Jeongeupia naejangsanensis]